MLVLQVLLPMQLQRLQAVDRPLEELHGSFLLLASLTRALKAAVGEEPESLASGAAAGATLKAEPGLATPARAEAREVVSTAAATPETRDAATIAATAAGGVVDDSMQTRVRNSLVLFEHHRPYRRRGGDLLREAACAFISSIGMLVARSANITSYRQW